MNTKQYQVRNGKDIRLSKAVTHSEEGKSGKKWLRKKLTSNIRKISNLQYKLFAENRQSLLVIFQGMDSAGKDGTIKSIMNGVNPQGVSVHSFKHPSEQELEHDYLWRHEQYLPEHGQIAIWNRSHYENVLISKVHPEFVVAERLPEILDVKAVDKKFWNARYQQINDFENSLAKNGIQVLKIFLHISRQEQCKRFLERINQKKKHWKFSPADITERKFWDQYSAAYELALCKTSTGQAPWYIIPADDKRVAHVLISKLILDILREMHPSFPPRNKEEETYMKKEKLKLTLECNHQR
jgi:PPK2 family polyphosphate:nucleotide phosphotransferase